MLAAKLARGLGCGSFWRKGGGVEVEDAAAGVGPVAEVAGTAAAPETVGRGGGGETRLGTGATNGDA